MNGIKQSEEKKEGILSPKKCPRCSTLNEAGNKFCKYCGFVLDKEEANNIIIQEQKSEEANNLMNQLLQDPEVKELIKIKLNNWVK
jgi:RNA polymerase subunit RPABC4/transcription elongation factor Spt4